MASPLVEALTMQNNAHPAQSQIAPTDVVGAYRLASDVAEKNYEQKLAKQNAQFGGLAQMGGAGIAAFGPKAYGGLFGTPGTGVFGSQEATPGLFGHLWGGGAAATTPASGASSAVSGAAPAVPWSPSTAGLPWPGGATTLADNSVLPAASAPTAGGGSVGGIDIASLFPNAAPTASVASDMGLAGATPVAGTVAADMGAGGAAAGAAGADLAAGGAAAAGAGGLADAGATAAAGLPEWLASVLPFLALA
jgi:hypothetical protein